MLSKIQKIWLGIFGAMFLIPEILWSPIINFYYGFFQSSYSSDVKPWRDNFLQNYDNLDYLKIIYFIQFISLLVFIITLIKSRKNIKLSLPIFILIIVILSLFFIMLAFAWAFISTFSINIM